MLQIFTDSTADLSLEMSAQAKVTVIPLTVHLNGVSFKDGCELSSERLFDLVQQTGRLPQTAAPSVGEYMQAFRQADEGLYIGISSRLSASVQNARLAAVELGAERFSVIDSHSITMGIGLLVLLAAELRDQGASRAEIEAAVKAAVPRVRLAFTIDTLEYLHKGGRCSAMQAVVGSMLKIRPVVEMLPDGTMGVREKVRGTRRKALQSLFADITAHREQVDLDRVVVMHAACEPDGLEFAEEISGCTGAGAVRVLPAGSVISSHCGPNSIGLVYMLN